MDCLLSIVQKSVAMANREFSTSENFLTLLKMTWEVQQGPVSLFSWKLFSVENIQTVWHHVHSTYLHDINNLPYYSSDPKCVCVICAICGVPPASQEGVVMG